MIMGYAITSTIIDVDRIRRHCLIRTGNEAGTAEERVINWVYDTTAGSTVIYLVFSTRVTLRILSFNSLGAAKASLFNRSIAN